MGNSNPEPPHWIIHWHVKYVNPGAHTVCTINGQYVPTQICVWCWIVLPIDSITHPITLKSPHDANKSNLNFD